MCYSRLLYLEFSLATKLEDFLRCHQNGLRFFGGYMRNRQVLDPQLDCHEPNCLLAFGLHNDHFTHPLG